MTPFFGDGRHWHHIVEQNEEDRFGSELIHNTGNLISIPGGTKGALHGRINGYYTKKSLPFTNGLSVRAWLKVQDYTFEEQYKFGIDVLKKLDNG